MIRPIRLALLASMIVLALASCSSSSSSQSNTIPCPFKVDASIKEGKDVICTSITVHETPSDPKSQVIKLPVATFKSHAAKPASDPVIYLTGGPGGALLDNFAPYITSQNYQDWVGDRDLVLFDQRGTGYATPSLQCSETVKLTIDTIDQSLTAEQSVQLENRAIQQCHDRLAQQGINLSAYTTLNNAADVQSLISALGFKQVNLYGVSYGTRLALEVLRSYPQHVRSVVLDSTFPPQENSFTDVSNSIARVFRVFFDGCASDSTCNQEYPNLEQTFYTLVDQLNASPIKVNAPDPYNNKAYSALINGTALASTLFQSLYVTSLIPNLPAIITQVQQGNTTLFGRIFGIFTFDTSLSQGMYESVTCSEDAPFTTADAITQSGQILPDPVRSDLVTSFQGNLAACGIWNVKSVNPAAKNAVTSDIPTLILKGEYDPITPPANGDLAAKTLSHSYAFQFPGTGHGVYTTNACPDSIVHAFYDAPTTKPDSTCIAKMTEPQFQ
jgi:pimeloyl-ACP methyl ester carboxylesterase